MTGSVMGAIGGCAAAMSTPGSTSTTVGPTGPVVGGISREAAASAAAHPDGRTAPRGGHRRHRHRRQVLEAGRQAGSGEQSSLFPSSHPQGSSSRGFGRQILVAGGLPILVALTRLLVVPGFVGLLAVGLLAVGLLAVGLATAQLVPARMIAGLFLAVSTGRRLFLLGIGLLRIYGTVADGIIGVLVAGVAIGHAGVSKGHGSGRTTDQQARCHEAGRSGDAHTRTHVVTTLQGVTAPAM